ncbi:MULTISPECIES: hypothetical protein [Rheinheimera]|uniref:Uncharacterized protein n=1 Tax=Rheinheimera marina TaxID=1774958 RepID=A0ABV9JQE8_9GAMM
MNTLNTTVETSNATHASERRVTALLLVRRLNALLAKMGQALNLSGAVYLK